MWTSLVAPANRMPVAEGPGEGGASEPARFWPSRAVAPPTGEKNQGEREVRGTGGRQAARMRFVLRCYNNAYQIAPAWQFQGLLQGREWLSKCAHICNSRKRSLRCQQTGTLQNAYPKIKQLALYEPWSRVGAH